MRSASLGQEERVPLVLRTFLRNTVAALDAQNIDEASAPPALTAHITALEQLAACSGPK